MSRERAISHFDNSKCRFCGCVHAALCTKPHSNGDYMIFYVVCEDCEARGPWDYVADTALARWNNPVSTPPRGLLSKIDSYERAKARGLLTRVEP